MADELAQVAARIRELREISGYSAEEVAQEVGIAVPLYQSYEESGGNIPISTLYRLANLYKVSMAELLTGSSPHIDTYTVVPAGQGMKIDRYPGYNFQGLAYNFKNKIMEPMVVTVDPGEGDPEPVQHPGQEMNYALEGEIEVIFDDKRLRLLPGDAIYFDPTHPHGQKALGGKPAKFLTIIAE